MQGLFILCSYHCKSTLCPRLTLVHCIAQTHLLVGFQLSWPMGRHQHIMIMKVFGTSPISAFHLQHYSSFWYELSSMTPTLIGFLYLSLYVLSFSTPRELTASYYCYLRVPHHPYIVPDLSMSFKCYFTGNLIIWIILSEFCLLPRHWPINLNDSALNESQ